MRLWIGLVLCLCASLTGSAPDQHQLQDQLQDKLQDQNQTQTQSHSQGQDQDQDPLQDPDHGQDQMDKLMDQEQDLNQTQSQDLEHVQDQDQNQTQSQDQGQSQSQSQSQSQDLDQELLQYQDQLRDQDQNLTLSQDQDQTLNQDQDLDQDEDQDNWTAFDSMNQPAAKLHRCNKAGWHVPCQYLVMLRPGTSKADAFDTIDRLTEHAVLRGDPVGVRKRYGGVQDGFLVTMSGETLNMAMQLPHVLYIEEDSAIFGQSAPWNLQRLLQPYGGTSENGTYKPPNDGGRAEVYLMDGSVQSSHREIERRVRVTDFNNIPEEDGVRVHRQASQCESHGTHVAGVVCGSDSGVAPGAGVNLVRVLNCQGKGTVSGALAGMEYIRAAIRARPRPRRPVVVLLPFVGGYSRSLNAACRALVANGAVVIAAAGNHRDDACLYSPASEPEVITVGAVNSAYQLMAQGAGGSNFGRCVDLFAPGDDIVSASSDCSSCFASSSGTSQAAAHAAGVAAVLMSSVRRASPVQVLQMMLHYSISNLINVLPLSHIQQLTSPNLVAAMPPVIKKGEELLCRSVWSERSGVTSSDRAVVRCRRREEMMSCSSFAAEGASAGETIAVRGGQVECVAYNGPAGGGVHAVARCCVIAGLRCQVHASPKPGRDAECVDPQHHLTGCTSWSTDGVLSVSRPHHGDRKRCITNQGVTSHAVCCHAPSLECRLLENASADKDQVEVSCPSGWTLTDCSSLSPDPADSGPVAKGNSCRVRSASAGAAAAAVCCRAVKPREPPTSTLH